METHDNKAEEYHMIRVNCNEQWVLILPTTYFKQFKITYITSKDKFNLNKIT